MRLEYGLLHFQTVMSGTCYNLLVVPFLAWMVGLSLAVVGYLVSLTIKEKRRNRQLNVRRQQLGLRPELRSSWQLLF